MNFSSFHRCVKNAAFFHDLFAEFTQENGSPIVRKSMKYWWQSVCVGNQKECEHIFYYFIVQIEKENVDSVIYLVFFIEVLLDCF